jgi:hypothetical protein
VQKGVRFRRAIEGDGEEGSRGTIRGKDQRERIRERMGLGLGASGWDTEEYNWLAARIELMILYRRSGALNSQSEVSDSGLPNEGVWP